MPPLGPSTPVARRAHAAAMAVRGVVLRHGTRVWATVRRAWRQSLQLRIVLITLVVSAVTVCGFGVLVAKLISDGLVDDKRVASLKQVRSGATVAAQQLSGHRVEDPRLEDTINSLLSYLVSPPEQGVTGLVVAMRPDPTKAKYQSWPTDTSVAPAITDAMRTAVVDQKQVAHQLRTVDIGEGETTYLVYGTPVPTSWGRAELYYFFPLDREIAASNQVARTVIATGFALVLLLAVIAALVTRLVVRPVRLAARTAQRLSAGLLDQRMEVRGEDDLALLAASFNQMAGNLQRQILRLEEMSRLQRRFTSDVSHELRTPLTTVRMAADLIFSERVAFDPAVARSAELLQLELDRFEGLLTDLLEVSRFDAGFAVLDPEPTDLSAVVRRVADRLGPLAERAGTPIEVGLPVEPVIAEVDTRRVERILRNLVGNAVEHAEGRPVRVTLAADDGAVAMTVRDYGIGLQTGEEDLVFNRFWRSDPSRARQTGGTGLGLSISLEDARLHGGWLEAWGAPGRGAQFRLTLPCRAGDRLAGSPLRLVPDDAYLGVVPLPAAPGAEPLREPARAPAREVADV